MLEVIESNEDHSHVVERPSQQRVLQDVLHSHAALLVNVISEGESFIILNTVPYTLDSIFIIKFVENSITTENNEVVLTAYSE